MTPPPVRRVFLSYAREDLTWAEEQARTLRAAGIEVFLDVLTLRAGDDWAERIHEEIGRADQLRVGWSRYAAQSEWVRKEYTEALRVQRERGAARSLLVVLLDTTPLPEALKHIHAERSALSSPETDALLREPYREIPPRAVQPSVLLRPEYQVVPFHGRAEAIERMEAWCLSDQPFDLVLYVGPGGSGKTRLFAEACLRMRARGWGTGFLDGARAEDAFRADPDRLSKLLDPRVPRLIVIDYAESRRRVVQAIMERGARKQGGQPVRLALLARTAGDWWRELLRASSDFEPFLGPGHQPVPLAPLSPSPAERRKVFAAAFEAFRGLLGGTAPARKKVDLKAPQFGQALFLQLKALLAVMEDWESSPAELLDRLLDHEERYWRRVAEDVGLDRGLQPALAPSIALNTLVGGVAEGEELRRLLARSPLLADGTALERRAVGEVLVRLYGWERRIEALQPDRIGEALVAREIRRDNSLLHAWHAEAGEAQLRQGLNVLGRVGADSADGYAQLVEVLSTGRGKLVVPAMSAAVEGSEAMARALADALAARPDPELALRLVDELPQDTVMLREVAFAVTGQALEAIDDDARRAVLLNNLSNRLGSLGRRREAAQAIEKAVGLYRTLAAQDPLRFLVPLAGGLANQGSALSHLGRYEEARAATQTAIDIYRDQIDIRPGDALSGLWTGFNNLGSYLSQLGLRSEAAAAAQEAVDTARRLVAAQGGEARSCLAIALDNLGVKLYVLGRSEEALTHTLEAVEIHRALAAAQPDAFLPFLANSLINLSNHLRVLRRADEALTSAREAVRMYRRLVATHRNAFLPNWAGALNNQGVALSTLGRAREALGPVQESVETYRLLAAEHPEVFLSDLASHLSNLGALLSNVERVDEAIEADEEAVEIFRERAAKHPATFLPELARALHNSGAHLWRAWRSAEAADRLREALEIRKGLADAEPDVFGEALRESLQALASVTRSMGLPQEEVTAAG